MPNISVAVVVYTINCVWYGWKFVAFFQIEYLNYIHIILMVRMLKGITTELIFNCLAYISIFSPINFLEKFCLEVHAITGQYHNSSLRFLTHCIILHTNACMYTYTCKQPNRMLTTNFALYYTTSSLLFWHSTSQLAHNSRSKSWMTGITNTK